jgi:tripartite ATP-independent transporter DctM subunit
MTPELLTILMFVGILVGVFLGFPIAFTLTGLGLIFGLIGWGNTVFTLLASRAYAVMTNYTYVAIPLFVFMGCMLERTGVAETAFAVLDQWLRKIKGGLAIATIILCTIFAACTGVVGASVTTMAVLVLPSMMKRGYSKELASGVVSAGGTLGILIPPSIMLVVFGPVAGVSVVDLFAAAVPPGLLLAALYILYIVVITRVKKGMAPDIVNVEKSQLEYTLKDGLIAFVPFIVLIFLVLGVIFFGVAAPTEAAGVGALGSILVAAMYRKCTWKALKESAMNTLKTSAMVTYVALGANLFTSVFFGVGGDRVLTNFILNIGLGPYGVFAIVLIIVFLLGMLIDWLGIVLIVIPIFMPILVSFGMDPLWVSMVIIVLLQTSFITPPFAYSIFYLKGVAPPEIELGHIYRGVVPFIVIQVIVVVLCIVFPDIVTFLPQMMAK